ncbi:MAG TPA: chemotaxis protein CheA [Longimicrobiaceae bacterium]|nr:chemotaxis protein CheA [Longimicrobiaceae bacterium]
MELSQYGELFLSESREHVSAINDLLLALEASPGSREPVEGVFRAVHTIKGMSATMGYRAVADLAHALEDLLDRVRDGRRAADVELVDLLFEGADALEHAIEAAVAEEEGNDPDVAPVIARLQAAAGDAPAEAAAASTGGAPGGAPSAEPVPEGAVRVRVHIAHDSPLPGVRAFMALRMARGLGEVSGVVPDEGVLQGPEFAGTLEFLLRTGTPAAEVEAALRGAGDVERVEVAVPGAAAPTPTPAAEEAAEPAAPAAAPRARNIRVDLRRLDALMNQIGELVIIRDRLQKLAALRDEPELGETVDQAARLISELQDEIMQARMVPVGQVFDRFPRLVRDAARMLGKRVEFAMEGKEIEFDRSMLDEIGDPIVHLLRNSLDHGIESPGERRAAGKPETGMLHLLAARERSQVLVRVEDDGRGISRERVLAKAVSAGLVSELEAQAMPDDEVHRLLTRPGFSTADRVTDVSGRGVGLDVVATRVRALGGTLEIDSEPGRGTAFTVRLPLTLAIVRALLVRLGEETYALPVTHVGETVEIPEADVRSVKGRTVALLREEVIPLLSLRGLLQQQGPAVGSGGGRRVAVVLESGEHRVGVEVDELAGQQEIVIKSFDATAGTLRIFSGATILSDGRPALILDVGSILAREGRAEAVAAA